MSAAPKQHVWDSKELRELFTSFPLLKNFPGKLIDLLVQAGEVLFMEKNNQILRQGQPNEHLYFLIDGHVGVYVDGGRVSVLDARGDMIGEMSVVTGRNSSATILSETPVTVVRINSRTFLESEGTDRELYMSTLYRIYSTVLAEKLQKTNHKAKHFEELTINLTATQNELREINLNLERKVEERTYKLEQQNVELMAGKNKMEDLLNTKKVVFHKLSEMQTNHLHPLKNYLDDFRKKNPDDEAVNKLRSAIFDVQNLITPLADQYSAEQQMQSKHVLLADANKKQQVVAKMALGGTGVLLDIVSTPEEGRAKLDEKTYDLLVFDSANIDLANAACEKNPKMDLVLMTSDHVPAYLPSLKALKVTPHIVSRDEEDRTFTVKNIMTTVTKLLTHDFFGLEKYISWGVEVQTLPVTSSKQRQGVLTGIGAYFENVGVRRANRERIHCVVEEMLMNAIYDAPVGPDGKSLYNHLNRSEDLHLKAEEQGMVRFATDGVLIAVSVQDPFGSLKGDIILKYLEANYGGTAQDINIAQNKGGAGRGLHQIVENSDLVVFNVDPGKKTEVIAFFNVEVKEKAHQNPSFHLFIKGK
jgi:CRP-like cAMP-binding protein/CheY-like chemotaxis protein